VGESLSWPVWLENSPSMLWSRQEQAMAPRCAFWAREAEASLPTRCHEELLGGVLDQGPPQGECPAVN
jgi:hypothetical protein